MKGRLCGGFELPDPCDASGDPHGSFDLVFGMAGRFIDESRSKGRISGKPERAATHLGVVGNPPKPERWPYILVWLGNGSGIVRTAAKGGINLPRMG